MNLYDIEYYFIINKNFPMKLRIEREYLRQTVFMRFLLTFFVNDFIFGLTSNILSILNIFYNLKLLIKQNIIEYY